MKKFKFSINGNPYESAVISVEDGVAEVEINGTVYKVEVDKELKTTSKTPKLVRPKAVPDTDFQPSVAKTSSPGGPKGAGTIKSPLPGVIIEMFVKEGDTVSRGQKLLVLEAMKMENNIESDKAGKILSISKGKGDSVMEGDLLIEIGD